MDWRRGVALDGNRRTGGSAASRRHYNVSKRRICARDVLRDKKPKVNNWKWKEKPSYENTRHGYRRNHLGDTIEMDTAGADVAGDPSHRPCRDRLSQRTSLLTQASSQPCRVEGEFSDKNQTKLKDC